MEKALARVLWINGVADSRIVYYDEWRNKFSQIKFRKRNRLLAVLRLVRKKAKNKICKARIASGMMYGGRRASIRGVMRELEWPQEKKKSTADISLHFEN